MDHFVFLLNGPSSAGKSILADQLKEAITMVSAKTVCIISIDDFLSMDSQEPIYEDDVFEIMPQMSEKIQSELTNHNVIIIDHVITSKRIYESLVGNLYGYPVLQVFVSAPLEVLRMREENRGNRCVGSAEASLQYLYPQNGYDVSIDTYFHTAQENAITLLKMMFMKEDCA